MATQRRRTRAPEPAVNQSQMVKAEYLNDAGETIFKGLVPKDLKTDRAAGMRWVAEQDRLRADTEAAQAEEFAAAEAARLAEPPPPDPLEVATAAGSQAAGLQQEVAELRQIVSQLQMATGEQVITGGLQISRVAAGTEEIRSALNEGLATINQAGVDAQSTLAGIQAEAESSTAQVSSFIQAASASVEQTNAEMKAKTARAISKQVTGMQVQVSEMRGPRGKTGAPGSGIMRVNGNPNNADPQLFLDRMGRNPVPADEALQQAVDGHYFWTYTGEQWEQSAFIPVDVRVESRPLSIYDASTKVQSTITNITNKGGSGSSSPLSIPGRTLSGATGSGLIRAAAADQFGAPLEKENVYCKGADLILHLQAMDGPNAGDHYFAHHFVTDNSAGSDSFTTYAELGRGDVTVEIEMSQGAGNPPANPASGASTTVSATHTPILSIRVVANSSGATQFQPSGDVRWAMPSQANGEPLKPTW